MRKLTFALVIALLAAGFGTVSSAGKAAAAYEAKVVIVVGQTQGITASYINDANNAAAVFAKYTSNITKVYSPNATWGAVLAAASGANILVYMGHGSGYPNPYNTYYKPNGDNGMGLNAVAGSSDSRSYYYGENYMAQLQLAPGAVVILNHLCYASGNSESGYVNPALSTAKTRADGYAAGFIRAGAKAVIAEGTNSIGYYIDTLFTGHTTVDAMWKAAPSAHGNFMSYPSSRDTGYTSQLDPDVASPVAGGPERYYRSMVSIPSSTTDAAISGQVTPFVASSGSYFPISPTRIVDTRTGAAGPSGTLSSLSGYTYQIAGKQVGSTTPVPSKSIAITANVTVTGQTAAGYLYIGPTMDKAPSVSTINFPTGDDRANGVTIALSPQGTIGAYYGAPSTGSFIHLIIDVTGYFLPGTSGAGYVAFGPKRVLDTRAGSGIPGLTGPFMGGTHRVIQIAGVAGLPASGIVAVTGNLTVVSPSASGYMTLGPDKTDAPTSSTINFPRGDVRANNVIVPVNADGTLSAVYVSSPSSSLNLVLDISGYFTTSGGSLFNTLDPARIMDSRSGAGLKGPFSANVVKTLQVTGSGGVASGAVAVTANLTVTDQNGGGFAAVGPVINSSTPFSNLNFPIGDARANGTTVPLASNGSLQIVFASAAGRVAQLLLDVTGYYLGTA
jgi:hypothetical protein